MLALGYRNYIALVIPVLIALMLFLDYFGRLVTQLSQRPYTAWDYVLTSLLDWLGEAAIITGLALNTWVNSTLVIFAVVSVVLTSFTGVLTAVAGADQRQTGMLQRRDRLILIAILTVFIPWLSLSRFAVVLSVLLIAGCTITIGQRLFYAREKLIIEQKS